MFSPEFFKKQSSFVIPLAIIIPFLVWITIFKNFNIHGDTYNYYHWIKYYLDGIAQGEYPMWNPFYAWGSQDDFDMRFMGEFNPLLYIPLVLNFLGIPFNIAFGIYFVFYYFVGLLGFYSLASIIFNSKKMGYLAYLLLLFSCMGIIIFGQLQIILIFVPGVWLYYFLIQLIRTGLTKYLLACTFSVMILEITYMPFHFLVIFISSLFGFVLSDPIGFFQICKSAVKSLQTKKIILLFCAFSIIISAFPGYTWIKNSKKSEYVLALSRGDSNDSSKVQADIKMINWSTITSQITITEMFDDLDLGGTQFFYVSSSIFLIFLLSFFNRWNKRSQILFLTLIFVLLVSLADITPVHPFLYKHFRFFSFFRNLYFFNPIVVSLLILFAVDQLFVFLKTSHNSKAKKRWGLVYVLFSHSLFFIFLLKMDHVLVSSYLSLFVSLVLFLVCFLYRQFSSSFLFFIILCFVLIFQPIEASYYYAKYHTKETINDLTDHWKPKFLFVRPKKGKIDLGYRGYQGDFKKMQDVSGFLGESYFGVNWSYFMHENMGYDFIKEYVRHKFFLYDNVAYYSDDETALKRIEEAIEKNENLAFVFKESFAMKEFDQIKNVNEKAVTIDAESNNFNIKKYKLNSIRFTTNFQQRKFLVYNDSYHSKWEVFINGEQKEILRSNIAFKGIWLEAGKNDVYFRFGNQWAYLFYQFLLLYFAGFLIYLGYIYIKDRKLNFKNVKNI